MKTSSGRECDCIFSHGLDYDPLCGSWYPSSRAACLWHLKAGLLLSHFCMQIPSETTILSNTNRILLNLDSKALPLTPMEALSWSSCQKCSWTSSSQFLSSWSRTLLLRSVSWTVNSFLLLRIRTCCLWEAQHQFSRRISCFSEDPI